MPWLEGQSNGDTTRPMRIQPRPPPGSMGRGRPPPGGIGIPVTRVEAPPRSDDAPHSGTESRPEAPTRSRSHSRSRPRSRSGSSSGSSGTSVVVEEDEDEVVVFAPIKHDKQRSVGHRPLPPNDVFGPGGFRWPRLNDRVVMKILEPAERQMFGCRLEIEFGDAASVIMGKPESELGFARPIKLINGADFLFFRRQDIARRLDESGIHIDTQTKARVRLILDATARRYQATFSLHSRFVELLGKTDYFVLWTVFKRGDMVCMARHDADGAVCCGRFLSGSYELLKDGEDTRVFRCQIVRAQPDGLGVLRLVKTHVDIAQNLFQVPTFLRVDKLPVAPLSALPVETRSSIRERLMTSSRKHYALFGSSPEARIQHYRGPCQRFTYEDGSKPDSLGNTNGRYDFGPGEHMKLQVDERVQLGLCLDEKSLISCYRPFEDWPDTANSFDEIPESMWLTFAPLCSGFLLDSRVPVTCISISTLSDVQWDDDFFGRVSVPAATSARLKSLVEAPGVGTTKSSSATGTPKPKVVCLRGSPSVCLELCRAIAETTKRPFMDIPVEELLLEDQRHTCRDFDWFTKGNSVVHVRWSATANQILRLGSREVCDVLERRQKFRQSLKSIRGTVFITGIPGPDQCDDILDGFPTEVICCGPDRAEVFRDMMRGWSWCSTISIIVIISSYLFLVGEYLNDR